MLSKIVAKLGSKRPPRFAFFRFSAFASKNKKMLSFSVSNPLFSSPVYSIQAISALAAVAVITMLSTHEVRRPKRTSQEFSSWASYEMYNVLARRTITLSLTDAYKRKSVSLSSPHLFSKHGINCCNTQAAFLVNWICNFYWSSTVWHMISGFWKLHKTNRTFWDAAKMHKTQNAMLNLKIEA